jgi:hypothetical protein
MSANIQGEPRPELITVRKKRSARTKRPGEKWFETRTAFVLYDAFCRVDTIQKEKVCELATTDGSFIYVR